MQIFAGLGDPLLRLGVVEETAKLIKAKRHGVRLRLTTNGLVTAQVTMPPGSLNGSVCTLATPY
jgi:MoaA/NifB/PqqE/SkfB family radical SAM enzyme